MTRPAPGRPRLCFVADNAFGMLSGRPTGHSGGVERYQAIMARWFANRGYDVSMVTWDEGQVEERVAGVRIVKRCSRDAGLPGLRFFHPRWSSLSRALAAADADVYQYASTNRGLGQAVLFCRRRRRASVFLLMNNHGADAALVAQRVWRDRAFYLYGLRRVDQVVTQTLDQQRMLHEGFGVGSVCFPMPGGPLADGEYTPPPAPDPGTARVLWVGRVAEVKRLECMLAVAEACPELRFDVVGAPNAPSVYADNVLKRAAAVPNLTLHGRVSDNARLAALYRAATVFCCTSSIEGFPNTFLEAWGAGLPIVSSFDPDGVIARLGLGIVAHEREAFVGGLRGLIGSPERYREMSERCRAHYLQNHHLDAVMPRFETLYLELHASHSRRPGSPVVAG